LKPNLCLPFVGHVLDINTSAVQDNIYFKKDIASLHIALTLFNMYDIALCSHVNYYLYILSIQPTNPLFSNIL